jgi:AcrR family transcriptional regulator
VPTAPLAALPPARHTPKGERTRERILDTAERLFAEKGYEGATLRDVAAAAGLRTPSLYNHFAGKASLYAAVLERGIAPVLEALSEHVRAAPTRADSDRFIARVFGLLARRPELPRLIQQETLRGGGRLSPILSGWFKPTFAKAEEVLRASPGARRWSDDQIPLLVIALYHVAIGFFTFAPLYEALDREDLLSREGLARQTRFFGDLVAALLPADGWSDNPPWT